jgi:hypothetical protein
MRRALEQNCTMTKKISCHSDKIFSPSRKYLVTVTRYFWLGGNILS